MSGVAAYVGPDVVTVAEVDARERELRAGGREHALPRPGTSEARQLRRWLTQVLVTERVVAASDGADGAVPTEAELLPDAVARMEMGSVAAATLADPHGRAVFAAVTADVGISDDEVTAFHARNPDRFARAQAVAGGWRRAATSPDLEDVRADIAAHLLAAARRRQYRRWLDARCAELVTLADGFEHPGDPRQPDNTHRH
ncbi:malonyl CoA-ACP transacylase [Mycolicibacterium iranicum]|uniref:Malonyl CoA-ACP transacylase n=1 Tax=Mycolicibacterium iranicum TaxID=912594 RepID=A0ABT4HIV3_MYCIR|nr:malonyl CoA-ACP transacylase [Mycolicibacterium iranicum]MCZ0730134.1 malonyl CoA-ACP transacylase [Mycolicibacterium iranicum]